jgi:hypothetical protein
VFDNPTSELPTAERRFEIVVEASFPLEVKKANTGAICISDNPTPSI